MYNLPYFTEENEEVVFEFMKENSFAIITGHDGNFPVATHVPLDIKKEAGKIIFTGHIMKNSDHHLAFLANENVLVLFSGPHCYVSASWYTTKNIASTWNYIDVHAKGKIKFTDEEGTKLIIKNLTNKFETGSSEASFHNLPKEYVDRLVKAIIGFTIEVEQVGNVFKLSQNRDVASRKNIITKLEAQNKDASQAIAREMIKRIAE